MSRYIEKEIKASSTCTLVGTWILGFGYVLLCMSDMLLKIAPDISAIVKIGGFAVLATAVVLRPRFHNMVILLMPLFMIFMVDIARSFNLDAGIDEVMRFLFPICITIVIYAYRTSLKPVLIIFFAVVLSNDFYQCYAYAASIAGLPRLFSDTIDSGLYLRAQGWIGFFSEFSYMNFCAFVLCRQYYASRRAQKASWIFMIFSISGISFKIFPVIMGYFIIEKKGSIRAWISMAVMAIVTVAIPVSGIINGLTDLIFKKISVYIVAGNSARAESYRVMIESLAKGNFLGEGLGAFGGPDSTKYNSPLYNLYNFKWYGMQKILTTTDTFYPHLFVELGFIGGLIWLYMTLFYGQKKRGRMWWFMMIAFSFDNLFSMSMLSASYVFSAFLVMHVFAYPCYNKAMRKTQVDSLLLSEHRPI